MFRTELFPRPLEPRISHSDRILTLGSCFSEMLNRKLLEDKFEVLSNPLGIIYNPVSQHRLLAWALNLEEPSETWVANEGIYYHFDAHSRIHASDPRQLMTRVEDAIGELREFLGSARWLILTYGTAKVYTTNNRIVANCHKQPASAFSHRLLTVREMMSDIEPVIIALKEMYPHLNLLLTVSPIRHVRDTLEINSVSKSLLRVFCHEMNEQHPHIHYFPSFEIMMDDLRDYRFYARDMIHPSEVAEDYIYDKFCQSCFSPETLRVLQEWRKIRQALEHRPFHPGSRAYHSFLVKTLEKLEKFSGRLELSREISEIKDRLKNANH